MCTENTHFTGMWITSSDMYVSQKQNIFPLVWVLPALKLKSISGKIGGRKGEEWEVSIILLFVLIFLSTETPNREGIYKIFQACDYLRY